MNLVLRRLDIQASQFAWAKALAQYMEATSTGSVQGYALHNESADSGLSRSMLEGCSRLRIAPCSVDVYIRAGFSRFGKPASGIRLIETRA